MVAIRAIIMRYSSFVIEFLKHPKEIGTFTQSSKHLAKEIAKEIDGSSEVVEFGAGTGPVTTEILKSLPHNGRLTCFEINSEFCKYLEKIDDPRLEVINDDASNCQQYVDGVECIVSGLPLALFSRLKKDEILDIISKSRRYIQLQYTPLLRKRLQQYFSDVKIKFVPQNFPPAFIYVCRELPR